MSEKVNNEVNNEQKREIRVGRNTFGITMILFGISVIIQIFTSIEVLRYVLMIWPLVFISIGVEVLYYNNKKNLKIKYDVASILLVFLVVFFGSIFSVASYGVNKVLYNSNFRENIIEESLEDPYVIHFDDKVNFINTTDKKVILKVTEVANTEYTRAEVRINFDKTKTNNIITAMNGGYATHSFVDIDHSANTIIINHENDCIENFVINVITSNKDNIKVNGNIVQE